MANDTLVNRYQQYKAGTTKLVNWLAKTACSSGPVGNILPSLRNTHLEPTPGHRIRITTSQLRTFAHVITNASIVVPEDIFRTLRAVIRGREDCADWYSSFANSVDSNVKQQNSSHRHFISVLKEVEAALVTSRPESRPPDSPDTTQSVAQGKPPEEVLSNIFSYLEVEEPLENPLGSAPTRETTTEQHDFELDENEDGTYFALWCFFKDLNDVRQQIRTIWRDYKATKLAFSTAATITSFSMSLVSDLASELAKEYPILARCNLVYYHLGLNLIVSGHEVFLFPSNGVQQPIPHGQKQANVDPDFLCPRAWVMLRTFSRLMEHTASGVDEHSRTAEYAYFDVHPFGRHLGKVLHEIRPFQELNHVANSPSWVYDKFLGSLHLIAKHPRTPPPLWSLAACQLSMDVHDIVGTTPQVEMDRYHRLHAQGAESISRLVKQTSGGESFGDKARYCDHLRGEQSVLEAMASDPYQKTTGQVDDGQNINTPSFRVHQLLPIYTGLLTSTCLIITNRVGVSHGQGSFTVLSAAYLYRAALLAGVQTRPWPDMEMVIKSQSKKQPFVLEPGQGITSMPQCFGVALGLKLSAFSKGNRPPAPRIEFADKHGKKLEPWTLLTKSKSERYCQATRIAACLAGLERIAENRSHEVQALLDQYAKTGKLSPAQLLIGAREVFAADGEILDFDYIEFAMSCHKILDQIDITCGSSLRSLVAKIQKNKSRFNYEIAYAILWDTAEKSRKGTINAASFIAKAGVALSNVICQQGDVCCMRNVYSSVTFGPELPPDWNGDNAEQRTLRTFIGLPASASSSAGIYCTSESDARARAELYSLYLSWRRSDPTVSAELLCEAIAVVAGANIDRGAIDGQQESEASDLEMTQEILDVMQELDLCQHIPLLLERIAYGKGGAS